MAYLLKANLQPARMCYRTILIVVMCLLVWGEPVEGITRSAWLHRQEKGKGEASDAPRLLELGRPIECELAGGQKHGYQIMLAAGQYVDVTIEQRGIDVSLEVLSGDGRQIADVDLDFRLQGLERVEIVADAAQAYVISVQGKPGASAGRYEVRVTELRHATGRDQKLEEARKLNRESDRLLAENKGIEARLLAERILAIREEALEPEHPEVARAIQNLARISYLLEDYSKAELLFRRVIAIREKSLPPDHPDLAGSLTGLANVYYVEGLYTRANPLYRRALEIKEKAYGPDHAEVARAVKSLANSLDESHDYAQSELLFQRSLTMAEKAYGPNHPMYARALANLGMSYKTRGDYSGAESLAERALEIFVKAYGKDTRDFAPLLNSLGTINLAQGKYDKAESFFQRFMLLVQTPPHSLDLTIALNNLGQTYLLQGEYSKAEPLLRRSLKIREEVYGPDNSNVARSLNLLGDLARQQGDYDKAEPLYRRALMICERTEGMTSPALLDSLRGVAMIFSAKGDSVQSISYQKRINDIVERSATYSLAIGSERQKLAYLALISEDADRAVSLNAQLAPDNVDARSLGAITVLEHKGRVLDSMRDNVAALRRHVNAADEALFDRFTETISQLANLVLHGPQGESLSEHQKKIRVLEDQKEKIETDISHRSAGFYQGSQPITLAAVQAALPPSAALIEFSIYRPFDPKSRGNAEPFGEPRYVVYVLRSQGNVQFKDLGDAKSIDQAVDGLRQAVRDPQRKDVQKLARALDEKVLQPIRPLAGDATQLLISPDGGLNLLPFAALVDERGHYLIESYAVTYLTSGRDLLRMKVARASQSPPVIVADPEFGPPPSIAEPGEAGRTAPQTSRPAGFDYSQIYFAPLPGTNDEVRALKELLPNATFLTKERATKTALQGLNAPSILHIATHGFFLPNEPQPSDEGRGPPRPDATRLGKWAARAANPLLRSGLALAGANQPGAAGKDNGILTALEASGLNLWGTKLVVLSACDTGLGEVRSGDGVYGLRRALVLAGAESQLMSLWPISDRSTRDLMIGFYNNLVQGRGRGDALRVVQLHMLQVKAHAHPFYWASFIQTGEWANLEGKR